LKINEQDPLSDATKRFTKFILFIYLPILILVQSCLGL